MNKLGIVLLLVFFFCLPALSKCDGAHKFFFSITIKPSDIPNLRDTAATSQIGNFLASRVKCMEVFAIDSIDSMHKFRKRFFPNGRELSGFMILPKGSYHIYCFGEFFKANKKDTIWEDVLQSDVKEVVICKEAYTNICLSHSLISSVNADLIIRYNGQPLTCQFFPIKINRQNKKELVMREVVDGQYGNFRFHFPQDTIRVMLDGFIPDNSFFRPESESYRTKRSLLGWYEFIFNAAQLVANDIYYAEIKKFGDMYIE
jgi:hypothetical protein